MTDSAEIDRFLSDHGVDHWSPTPKRPGQKLTEIAGRICYMSFAKPRPGGNSAYLRNIIEVGHGSVLEHATFNLVITGVSRSFTHELIRHRGRLCAIRSSASVTWTSRSANLSSRR